MLLLISERTFNLLMHSLIMGLQINVICISDYCDLMIFNLYILDCIVTMCDTTLSERWCLKFNDNFIIRIMFIFLL